MWNKLVLLVAALILSSCALIAVQAVINCLLYVVGIIVALVWVIFSISQEYLGVTVALIFISGIVILFAFALFIVEEPEELKPKPENQLSEKERKELGWVKSWVAEHQTFIANCCIILVGVLMVLGKYIQMKFESPETLEYIENKLTVNNQLFEIITQQIALMQNSWYMAFVMLGMLGVLAAALWICKE